MTRYLLVAAAYGPEVMARLIRALPADQIDRPTGEDRFSPREVIAHLSDWEPVAMGRIRTAMEHDGAQIQNWDEDAMAIQNRYSESDLEEQLSLYTQRRSDTIALIKEVAKEDWTKSVVHPMWGQMTVRDLANLLVQHDMYHVQQLSALL